MALAWGQARLASSIAVWPASSLSIPVFDANKPRVSAAGVIGGRTELPGMQSGLSFEAAC